MKTLTFTLLAEGGSDRLLIPVIEWVIRSFNVPFAFEIVLAEPYASSDLADLALMKEMLRVYPCDVLVIHRDSDTQPLKVRRKQITDASLYLLEGAQPVPLVPVRMTEAWFLKQESAVRAAVGNPHGQVALQLPPKIKWEKLSDPKKILLDSLTEASELTGRRLKQFNPHQFRARVGELITDFSYLSGLASFDQFESDMKQTLANL
jgi:hypothetical protein